MRALFWFRKDLRLADNTGLSEAVRDCDGNVVPFYASEPSLLARPDMTAIRVQYVLDALTDLSTVIEVLGSRLVLDHGEAVETVPRAARAAGADAVYWNDEYEPALRMRDNAVARALEVAGIRVRRFHDRLLVPPDAVTSRERKPFVVYTPFRRACEGLPLARPLPAVTRLAAHDLPARRVATLSALGFTLTQDRWPSGVSAAQQRLNAFLGNGLRDYATKRDFMAEPAHSRLSADLKFGALSPRTVVAAIRDAGADAASMTKYIEELRWRDFYTHVLFHHPHVEHESFRPAFRNIRWEGDPRHFEAWREGRTGFPIVDAAMRQLEQTGFMHNRARMIVASFLTKDLLLDWRQGERHFMTHLVDGDLASNNGGWQWAASTGTDPQPWFRIFNPVLQGERFDPEGAYVRRWVPELSRMPAKWIHKPWEAPPLDLAEAGVTLGENYPAPIVDHGEQRERALAMYREAESQ